MFYGFERVIPKGSSPKVEKESVFERVQALREFFHDSPDNLYVKGSYVRGDAPYGDIDIMIFNENGARLAKEYPKEFKGIPISYSVTPLESLEDYLRICMRSVNGLMESSAVHLNNPKVGEIIEEQKAESMEKRLPAYALFVYMEEVIDERKILFSLPGTPEYRKRFRGGKRTASRIIWMTKALHPELYTTQNTKDLIAVMVEEGYMDQETADDCESVLSMTGSLDTDDQKFSVIAERVNTWFHTTLAPKALTLIQEQLGDDAFFQSAKTSIDIHSSQEELDEVFEYAAGELTDHKEWMIMFALAAHPKTSQSTFETLFERYRGLPVYRHIIRNLLRNKSFDISRVDPEDLTDYPMALGYYNKRREMKI